MMKITESQEKTLLVLKDIGGWATSQQLRNHGASHSAATALIKHGIVEQRKIEYPGRFTINEWRLVK